MKAKKQITKRPTQDLRKDIEAPKNRVLLVSFVKLILRKLLLNPKTWHFLQVHVPEIGAKIEQLLKDIISFFSDLL